MNENVNCKQLALENKRLREEVIESNKKDQTRTLSTLKFPVFDGDGEVDGSGAIVTDITKSASTKKELHKSNVLFGLAEQLGKLGHWEWDEIASRYITCSEQYASLFGQSVDHVLKKITSIEEDQFRVCEEDRERYKQVIDLARETKQKWSVEYSRYGEADKRVSLYEVGELVLDDHGVIIKTRGMIQDITKIRRLENELLQSQALFKQAEAIGNMGHFHWDLGNDKLISCSGQFARIYGMTVREALDRFVSVEALIDLIHPDDKELFRQSTSGASDNGPDKKKNIEYKVIIQGKTRYLSVRREVAVDENGLPSQVFGIVQDITAEKKKENALLQSIETVKEAQSELKFQNHVLDERTKELFITNKELAFQNQEKSKRADELILVNEEKDLIRLEADKTKSEFISTVSHELRTPLTSIKGALGLMKAGVFDKNPEKIPPILNIAYKNAERLNHLIDDILDIESLNLGKMRFHMAMTDLSAVVKEATSSNETYGSPYGVTFVCSGIEKPLFVNGDYHRLIQVIANLLSNAAKFSPPNGQVDVSLARHEGSLRISIRNDGEHIPESARDTLFDIFTQVDSSDVRQKGGSGLGLSIAKMIIKAHDGYIDFISEVDSGTTFYVALPELELSEVIQ